jgi:hypothetical protein
MAITSLDRIIDTNFLTKLSRVSGGSSGRSSSSNAPLAGQALYNSLRAGASNFAAGIQLLNGSATFLNISLDSHEKLLELTDKMQAIATKANKGNVSGSDARQYRMEFDALAEDFEAQIEKATSGETDFFDPTELEATLVRAGLEKKRVGELAVALRKLSSPAETTVSTDGSVSADGNPVPLAEFQKALKSAIFNEDDPSDDRSGFFRKVKDGLQDIQIKLQTNIKSLKSTAKLVGDNMTLVRAAGFAFLDVSNEMTGGESAEDIAEQLRSRIRSTAASVLAQSNNLEPIMVAGLAAISESKG